MKVGQLLALWLWPESCSRVNMLFKRVHMLLNFWIIVGLFRQQVHLE